MGSESSGTRRRRRALTINTTSSKETKEKEEERMTEPLSPAARLFHQPSFNCHIVSIMGMSKRIDVDAIKAGLEDTLVRHPRFSSVLVSDGSGDGKERWLRTKVVIDNHIVVPNLEDTDPTSSPDELVERYVSSLTTTTLPLSRPLWDFHILNTRTSEAEAVAVLRAHHSLGDGVSLISLLLACTRKTADPGSLPSLPESRRRPTPNAGGAGLPAFLVSAWMVLLLVWHTLVDVLLFVATSTFLKDTVTALKAKDGVQFHRKRILHRSLSLDDVRVIKDAIGCTVNDVFVGITSAALSRYLSRRYGEIDDTTENEWTLPANVRLRTTVLVNIRQNSGIHELAAMMEGHGGARWGNRIGYTILHFPIANFEDPLDYIRKGMEIARRKKNSLEAIFTYASGALIVKLFGIKAAASLCHTMLRNTTVSFSNVAGPVEEIGFYGHPLVYIAPTVYGHPQAVTLHFQSYMNKIKLVLAVDELTVPDPNRLLDDFVESLKLTKDAIVKNSS